jgi:hypothetical protein
MAGDLEKELPVPALVQELTRGRPLHWQAAQYEGTRSEAEILVRFLALHPNTSNRFGSAKPLFGDDEVTVNLSKNRSGRLEAGSA